MRQFEVRQANLLLEVMLAREEESEVSAFMTDLAGLANISRVQAQVGLRTLVDNGRVQITHRGARGVPGRFRILDSEPVRMADNAEPERMVEAAESNATRTNRKARERTSGEDQASRLQGRELAAVRRENEVLRERLAILQDQMALMRNHPADTAQIGA
jgi:hypothetical protein